MENNCLVKTIRRSLRKMAVFLFVLTFSVSLGGCSSIKIVDTSDKQSAVTLLNESSGDNLIDGIDMVQEGDQVSFKLLGCDDPDKYEYQFFVKISGDEETDWLPQNEYGNGFTEAYKMVSGGIYSFRFYIRDIQNQKMQEIIVGSVDRGPRWVGDLVLNPDNLTVDLGAGVQILPELSEKVDAATLTFQVLVKYNQEAWTAVSDYQSLPLAPVKMEKEGICNICIKSLQKESGQTQVSGSIQVNVAEYQEENVELLMRTLMSYYGFYDFQDTAEIYDSLSAELLAVSKVFLYEFRNDPEALEASLKTQYEIKADQAAGVITIQNAAGFLKEINLKEQVILYGNDYISTALKDHPAIVKILENTKSLDDEQICAVIINDLVHNAYRYTATAGADPDWNEFYDSDAQCVQFSQILTTLLGKSGYVTKAFTCDRGEYGQHSVVEIGSGEKRLVLDPTYNVVYLRAMEDMEGIKDEEIIILPQIFDRYEFYKGEAWNNLINFGVTDEY